MTKAYIRNNSYHREGEGKAYIINGSYHRAGPLGVTTIEFDTVQVEVSNPDFEVKEVLSFSFDTVQVEVSSPDFKAITEIVKYFIDGEISKIIDEDYGSITLYGNGKNWFTA